MYRMKISMVNGETLQLDHESEETMKRVESAFRDYSRSTVKLPITDRDVIIKTSYIVFMTIEELKGDSQAPPMRPIKDPVTVQSR